MPRLALALCALWFVSLFVFRTVVQFRQTGKSGIKGFHGRVGVDETETTALVTSGLFAWIRNPIFSFIWLSLAGLVLLVPNLFSLLTAALTVVGIELQVRAVEEPYLASTHGDDYTHYAARVGRFVPVLGLRK